MNCLNRIVKDSASCFECKIFYVALVQMCTLWAGRGGGRRGECYSAGVSQSSSSIIYCHRYTIAVLQK